MLTKTDLSQIRGIIREEAGVQITSLSKEVQLIKAGVEMLKTKIAKIEKTMVKISDFLDREHLRLEKRVERIEEHFNLPKPF